MSGCYVQNGISYGGPIYSGNINTPIVKKNILVNSRNRDYEKFPNPDKYTIDLPRKYNNVVAACLINAEIPSKAVVKSNEHGFEDFRTLNTDQLIKTMRGALQKSLRDVKDLKARVLTLEETTEKP